MKWIDFFWIYIIKGKLNCFCVSNFTCEHKRKCQGPPLNNSRHILYEKIMKCSRDVIIIINLYCTWWSIIQYILAEYFQYLKQNNPSFIRYCITWVVLYSKFMRSLGLIGKFKWTRSKYLWIEIKVLLKLLLKYVKA